MPAVKCVLWLSGAQLATLAGLLGASRLERVRATEAAHRIVPDTAYRVTVLVD